MKKEITIFLSALMFLTRLPVPKNMDHNELYLQKAPKYFPLIGCLVALLSAVVFLVVHKFISPDIAILAMMITGILITGCFHEDGFADSCDAFGGGWTKEKILAIMKDSRLGTYGVAGLGFMLVAKFLLLKEIAAWLSLAVQSELQFYWCFLAISMAAHSSSRLMSVMVIQISTYVTSADGSKSKPLAATKLNLPELVTVCIFALLPFTLLPLQLLLVVFPMLLITIMGSRYFTKWIGGYTGDCLGAIQQVTEIIFYLSTLLIWKYIL